MAKGGDNLRKGGGGFKLFGVEINLNEELNSSSSESVLKKKRSYEGGEDEGMRKSKSMGNLHEEFHREEHQIVVASADDSGYHSDGLLHLNSRKASHIRKKGTPWTPSEHRSFLIGLKKLGKGDWKGISKNYVPTRTPTQVASHAQKYFIRMTAAEKKNRRASLFDIPFIESNSPPHPSDAAPFKAYEGSPQVITAAAAAPPLKKPSEFHGQDGLSAHIAASERKPPLSPMPRTYVPDNCHIPYMAGVPGQCIPVAHVMPPQTEVYPMMNYSYPGYFYVPTSHGNFPAPLTQMPNGMFIQPYPLLHRTSEADTATSAAGNFATHAPFNNQYRAAKGPATTVAKKDGLEASIGALSL